jgi:hypothetical protein
MLKFVAHLGGSSMLRHLVLINASEGTARTHGGGCFENTALPATQNAFFLVKKCSKNHPLLPLNTTNLLAPEFSFKF